MVQDVCVHKILCNTGYCALHYVIAFRSVICMGNERHLRNRKRQIKRFTMFENSSENTKEVQIFISYAKQHENYPL